MKNLKVSSGMAGALSTMQTSYVSSSASLLGVLTLHRSAPHQWPQPAPRLHGSSWRAKLGWDVFFTSLRAVKARSVMLPAVVRLRSGLHVRSCCDCSMGRLMCHHGCCAWQGEAGGVARARERAGKPAAASGGRAPASPFKPFSPFSQVRHQVSAQRHQLAVLIEHTSCTWWR
jgi:hypothetical protein